MKTVTAAEFRTMGQKRSKYGNVKQKIDDMTFDSQREGSRYLELRALEVKGDVRKLRTQYLFPIVIDGVKVCEYIADFVYEEKVKGRWRSVVEDCKGCRTDVYRIKRKLMKAVHGIDVRES